MKRVLQYISSIFLVSVYLLASVGVGIHECSAAGTRNVVIMLRDKPCELIHQHCSCGSHHCHSKAHSKKCCETHIHHLDHDYNVSHTDINTQSVLQVLIAYIYPVGINSDLLLPTEYPEILYGNPPPKLNQSTYSFYSQLRL